MLIRVSLIIESQMGDSAACSFNVVEKQVQATPNVDRFDSVICACFGKRYPVQKVWLSVKDCFAGRAFLIPRAQKIRKVQDC